ncbi:hypothetical protein J2741_001727 [Methanolinea mesophila]|uniref:hypothetical protein n=1 Tax=Methanolinea mesophila TaxID=547055 RepID=UPI001AE26475|nr:hypothetical protein [Methanolinea mesophila]MBP1929180.1 hypothetical protein [Methanolinea mesophila]
MTQRSYGMYLAYIVQALVGLNVIIAIVYQGPSAALITGALFIVGMIPYIFTWKTKIVFPWFVYFLVSLALLIHVSGYVQERYITFPNWDSLAHLISGTIVSIIGFVAILFADKIKNYNLDTPFIAIFVILFGMAMEYLWEIWEFFMDLFFGGSLAGPMQPNNADTMTDMIFVLLSSIIVAGIVYFYMNHHGKENIFHNMVKDSPYFNE